MALTKVTGQGVGTVDEVLIQKASSGATATSGTVLTVEDDDNTALSILGGSSSVLALNFGHSGDNDEGILSFNTTSGSEDMLLSSTKDITLRTTSTNATAGDINFKSYNTTVMHIDGGNNNVGIGTTSPSAKLHVVQGDAALLFTNTFTNVGHTACHFSNSEGSGAYRIRFDSNDTVVGSIGVGTSSTAYNTSSDYRLKENVVYDWDATTRLKQLKPARFNFIIDADKTVDGFLAHEAQAIVPESVTGTKDEVDEDGVAVMQSIDNSKLVPLLVKTIQELEARLTAGGL